MAHLSDEAAGNVDAEPIRQVATGVRASAMDALMMAGSAMELAGSLDGIARILEAEQKR